jgi:hypothetical protein
LTQTVFAWHTHPSLEKDIGAISPGCAVHFSLFFEPINIVSAAHFDGPTQRRI